MTEARLFALQRLTAVIMGPLVIVHLIVILYAVRGGLSAGEILARTGGNPLWPLFYALFVASAAIHAPIGLRNVLREWTTMPLRAVNRLMLAFGVLLLALGLRAVWAISGWAA